MAVVLTAIGMGADLAFDAYVSPSLRHPASFILWPGYAAAEALRRADNHVLIGAAAFAYYVLLGAAVRRQARRRAVVALLLIAAATAAIIFGRHYGDVLAFEWTFGAFAR